MQFSSETNIHYKHYSKMLPIMLISGHLRKSVFFSVSASFCSVCSAVSLSCLQTKTNSWHHVSQNQTAKINMTQLHHLTTFTNLLPKIILVNVVNWSCHINHRDPVFWDTTYIRHMKHRYQIKYFKQQWSWMTSVF